MAVTVASLVLQLRRRLGDWGALSFALTGNMTNAQATVPGDVLAVDYLRVGAMLECGVEMMEVKDPIGVPVSVLRGRLGTTAVTHATADLVVMEPRFSNLSIVDALNEALRFLGGVLPLRTSDVTLTTAASTEEYTIPSGVLQIERVELETDTSDLYRPYHLFEVSYVVGKLKLLGSPPSGRTIRLSCFKAYTEVTYATADLTTEVPARYHGFLLDYAEGELLLQEGLRKAAVVTSATGETAPLRENLIAAQTMKATAASKLEAIRPPTRIVQMRDKRVYRM